MEEYKTPLRPRHRVAKPQQQADGHQPWTASRCQRLLRPLLSRITLLRKDVPSLQCQGLRVDASSCSKRSTKRPAGDCPWLLPHKKLRRTYSQRCPDKALEDGVRQSSDKFRAARDLQRANHEPQIVAFTPLLRRIRGQHMSSPIQPLEVREIGNQTQGQYVRRLKHNFEQRLSALRTQVSPFRFSSYEAIFRNTEALLKAANYKSRTMGASSLMAMCLRRVPEYIAGIEAWERHEAEVNGTKSDTTGIDTGPRVYAELEALGPSNRGWVNLRTALVANAIAALTDAVLEGLFPDDLTSLLIELCSDYGVTHLGSLYEAFLARQYPNPSASDSGFSEDVSLQPLAFLRAIAVRTRRPSLLFQQISKLLFQGYLPPSWLATREFKDIWAEAFRAVSKGRLALDAIDFLATSMALLFGLQRSGKQKQPVLDNELALSCQRTLMQGLTLLAAMRRLGEAEVSSGYHPKVERVMRASRSLGFIFHACIAEIDSWKGRQGNLRDLLFLATFLSSANPQGERIEVSVAKAMEMTYSHKIFGTRHGKNSHEALISVIADIARHCGRGTSQASRHHFVGLCSQLAHLETHREALDMIKRVGAFLLADQSNDLRDLVYAENLVSNKTSTDSGESGCSDVPQHALFEGYCWDETISEWVMVSPGVAKGVLNKSLPRSMLPRATKRRRTYGPSTKSFDLKSSATETFHAQDTTTTPAVEILNSHDRDASSNGSGTSSRTEYITTVAVDHSGCRRKPNKRHSWAITSSIALYHDELGADKENFPRSTIVQKEYSDGVRRLSVTKRRIRWSGGHPSSDDELGM